MMKPARRFRRDQQYSTAAATAMSDRRRNAGETANGGVLNSVPPDRRREGEYAAGAEACSFSFSAAAAPCVALQPHRQNLRGSFEFDYLHSATSMSSADELFLDGKIRPLHFAAAAHESNGLYGTTSVVACENGGSVGMGDSLHHHRQYKQQPISAYEVPPQLATLTVHDDCHDYDDRHPIIDQVNDFYVNWGHNFLPSFFHAPPDQDGHVGARSPPRGHVQVAEEERAARALQIHKQLEEETRGTDHRKAMLKDLLEDQAADRKQKRGSCYKAKRRTLRLLQALRIGCLLQMPAGDGHHDDQLQAASTHGKDRAEGGRRRHSTTSSSSSSSSSCSSAYSSPNSPFSAYPSPSSNAMRAYNTVQPMRKRTFLPYRQSLLACLDILTPNSTPNPLPSPPRAIWP